MENEIVRNGDTFFASWQKQLMNQKIVNKTLNNSPQGNFCDTYPRKSWQKLPSSKT